MTWIVHFVRNGRLSETCVKAADGWTADLVVIDTYAAAGVMVDIIGHTPGRVVQ